MARIEIEGSTLDQSSSMSIDVEISSPVFNDRGSITIPATVPATDRNCRILDFPQLTWSGVDPNQARRKARVIDGAYIKQGVLNVESAGIDEGITLNIGLDNSVAYDKWTGKNLRDIFYWGVRDGYGSTVEQKVGSLLTDLLTVYQSAKPDEPLAVFPVMLNNTENDSFKVVNYLHDGYTLEQPTTLYCTIDDVRTEVTVPRGYGVTPFLRVWYILRCIFGDLNLKLRSNPFEHGELERVVVLNNVPDAICTGFISYRDLAPDCTVGEFLNSLWVRFGLVYNIDYDRGEVDLILMRDLVRGVYGTELMDMASGRPLITYNSPQYVRLSAATTLEGAAPPCERFEDFIGSYDQSKIGTGHDVTNWTFNRDRKWDGDVRGDFWDEPDPDNPDQEPDTEWPYPDDDRDYDDIRDDYDDRDDQWDDYYGYSARSAAPSAAGQAADKLSQATGTGRPEVSYAREYCTGEWSRLDSANNAVKEQGSGFFVWDPQPEGLEALELTSVDECVPVKSFMVGGRDGGYAPFYLTGLRHIYTYIKGSDDRNDDSTKTPLAFVQAITTPDMLTVGRISPEDEYGRLYKLQGGGVAGLSLYFQFKNGLFARFWTDYDEILRHGNRTVELSVAMDTLQLAAIDPLKKYKVEGIRCLLDKASYTLAGTDIVPVDMTLRTINTQGRYNITREQNVPTVPMARKIGWAVISNDLDSVANSKESRQAALDAFKASDTAGNLSSTRKELLNTCTYDNVELNLIEPHNNPWNKDTTMPDPKDAGMNVLRTYQVVAQYRIHLPNNRWSYYSVRMTIDFHVTLKSVWFPI